MFLCKTNTYVCFIFILISGDGKYGFCFHQSPDLIPNYKIRIIKTDRNAIKGIKMKILALKVLNCPGSLYSTSIHASFRFPHVLLSCTVRRRVTMEKIEEIFSIQSRFDRHETRKEEDKQTSGNSRVYREKKSSLYSLPDET